MLSDAQIERWSRQILVPEVGGRGQARLCAARVEVVGGGEGPTALVAELVERAGPSVTVVEAASEQADVMVAWGTAARPHQPSIAGAVIGTVYAARAVVTAVTTAPCTACVALHALPLRDARTGTALAPVTGRIAATVAVAEVVRLLLDPGTGGRTHHIDLAAGTFATEAAHAATACHICGAAA